MAGRRRGIPVDSLLALAVIVILAVPAFPALGTSSGSRRMFVPPRIVENTVRNTCPPLWVCSTGSACPVIYGVDLSVCSTNWSGYATVGKQGSVGDVHGSWVVPRASCPAHSTRYGSFWVGIDGYNSTTVEQVGTDSDCVDGMPVYYAWYEYYPESSVVIGAVNVSQGDKIAAGVSFDNATGEFTTFIQSSGGGSNSSSESVPGALRTSAEWIVEAPKICGDNGCTTAALTGFGTVEFGKSGSDNATVGGMTGTLRALPEVAITLMPHCVADTCIGPILAEPALPGPDGTSFKVGRGGTFVSVACDTTTAVGVVTECTAAVEGHFAPYGSVSWTATGLGVFSRRSCRLVNGSCSVGFTPSSVGIRGFTLVTASYPGDGNNLPSFGAADLTVAQRASETAAGCVLVAGARTLARAGRCTATVLGFRPTGTVRWTVTSGVGQASLPSDKCTLVRGRCSVNLVSVGGTLVYIEATYDGDRNNAASQNSTSLTFP